MKQRSSDSRSGLPPSPKSFGGTGETAFTGREGIALIAVLGFLSILVLMAVAFLMNMRTERLVAEAAKDDVRTRQLVRSALASAMDNVDGFLHPSLSQLYIHMPSDYAVFESTNGTVSLGNNVHLIDGQVTNWLPRHFLPGGNFDASWIEQTKAKWVLIKDPSTNKILGRYAFLVMDCTGMMDANLTDFPVQRRGGTSITEVTSAFLPEVGGTLESQYLFNNRTNYALFGTFPEILFLNDGDPKGSVYPEKPALGLSLVNNLIPYSLCYDNGWWDWTTGQWMLTGIGGTPIDVRSWLGAETNAMTVFNSVYLPLGYTAAQCDQMGRCAVDYMDGDDQPRGPGGLCDALAVSCEAFPMINEITAENRIRIVGPDLLHEVLISVELWYPFPANTNNIKKYTVTMSGAPDWSFVCGASNFTPTVLGSPWAFDNDAAQPFHIAVFTNTYSTPVGSVSNTDDVVNRKLRKVRIEVHEGDAVGPLVDATYDQGINTLTLPNIKAENGSKSPAPKWTACNDPRLNHLSTDWYKPQLSTMGDANMNIVDSLGKPIFGISFNGDLEGTNMYVRNSTNLSSAAELGFIPLGVPWTTVDLFSRQGRDLLASCRTRTLPEKMYTNGFINPNSLYTNVLFAAFSDAPVDEYPGGPVLYTVDSTMARDIVDGMYADITNSLMFGSNSYDSAAGWVTSQAFKPVNGALMQLYKDPPYNMDNNKKESIIRNSYQLFNPNQQLFTIVTIAQTINDQGTIGTFDGEDVDTVSGEKRAVALVWRDPFPGPSGRHETFVKLFKYLDE